MVSNWHASQVARDQRGKLTYWQDYDPGQYLERNVPIHEGSMFGQTPVAVRLAIVLWVGSWGIMGGHVHVFVVIAMRRNERQQQRCRGQDKSCAIRHVGCW